MNYFNAAVFSKVELSVNGQWSYLSTLSGSKLSSYSECRLALSQTPSCYQLFIELLSKHHQKQVSL